MIREREVRPVSGGPVAILLVALELGLFAAIVTHVNNAWVAIPCVLGMLVVIALLRRPVRRAAERGEGASALRPLRRDGPRARAAVGQPVLQQAQGLHAHPQLREQPLKVNDHDGSPIEIAAVVVWRVVDTAEAVFEVDSFENFVHVQSESALRNLATHHTYDAHEDDKMSAARQHAGGGRPVAQGRSRTGSPRRAWR